MSEIVKISRRDLLKAGVIAGGGLLLGFRLPFGSAEAAAKGTT